MPWAAAAGWKNRRYAIKSTSSPATSRRRQRSPGDAEREFVFHLAALIAIPYSYRAPASYVRTNVQGTLHVLQAARNCGIARLVHTSTSEVYGTARYVPIDEQHPLQGQSPYSASKIGADKMAEAFIALSGFRWLRCGRSTPSARGNPQRAVIPTIIIQCLAGKQVVRLGSVSPTRDMNFVANTVDGFLAAAGAERRSGRWST